ncbi:MAG: hypothetical protein MJY90_04080 [Bacteroidaceae bacterium]|nr:hypothetical protein [Bacteroidaceae bacterium]
MFYHSVDSYYSDAAVYYTDGAVNNHDGVDYCTVGVVRRELEDKENNAGIVTFSFQVLDISTLSLSTVTSTNKATKHAA